MKTVLLTSGTPPDSGKSINKVIVFLFLGNILVCTPKKLINALKYKMVGREVFQKLTWLVVDEADRLFDTTEGDRNFRDQVSKRSYYR